MFTIGRLAAKTHIGVETVRYYQREGLLDVPTSPAGGVRQYNLSHVQRIHFIKNAQTAGFTLKEIKQLVAMDASRDHDKAREMANQRITLLDSQLIKLQHARASLKQLAAACEHSRNAPCPIIDSFLDSPADDSKGNEGSKFRPRLIQSDPAWRDPDGVKIYTISANNRPVEQILFSERLQYVKAEKGLCWQDTAAFAIFHEGATLSYLILAWWGNDNELFTSVSASTPEGWVEDPTRFSFCLWDLEVFWNERNAFIEYIYCAQPCLDRYRAYRYVGAHGHHDR